MQSLSSATIVPDSVEAKLPRHDGCDPLAVAVVTCPSMKQDLHCGEMLREVGGRGQTSNAAVDIQGWRDAGFGRLKTLSLVASLDWQAEGILDCNDC